MRTLCVSAVTVGLEDLTQLIAVCCNQLLFQSRGLELNRNVIAIGGDQAIATLEAGNIHDFRIGQF